MTAESLQAMITTAVKAGLEGCSIHQCPIPKDAQEEIGHIFGMVKDFGNGEAFRGVEAIRVNHIFTTELRSTMSGTAKKIYYLFILALVSGIGTAFWLGLRHLLTLPGANR